ncbi:hypothetical protein NQ318_009953 [Aromia moschata]|uniref:Uncharacterized protein n=1 Tax=Aromia moschata TaxID=1265417 RepID=A0AAV8YK79_9CUCU|nr:hypothetical protein NQ318_009953 [Aromia moschata]
MELWGYGVMGLYDYEVMVSRYHGVIVLWFEGVKGFDVKGLSVFPKILVERSFVKVFELSPESWEFKYRKRIVSGTQQYHSQVGERAPRPCRERKSGLSCKERGGSSTDRAGSHLRSGLPDSQEGHEGPIKRKTYIALGESPRVDTRGCSLREMFAWQNLRTTTDYCLRAYELRLIGHQLGCNGFSIRVCDSNSSFALGRRQLRSSIFLLNRYGNRQMLINEDELNDRDDMRHFTI